MGRRIAVVALWMAVVATALAVPAPSKEDQAAVQQKGEWVKLAPLSYIIPSCPAICFSLYFCSFKSRFFAEFD